MYSSGVGRLFPKYFLKFACTSGSVLLIALSIVASISARTSANDTPPAFAPAFNAFFISLLFSKKLLIGHFSARYEDENVLLQEASAIFPDTQLAKETLCVSV